MKWHGEGRVPLPPRFHKRLIITGKMRIPEDAKLKEPLHKGLRGLSARGQCIPKRCNPGRLCRTRRDGGGKMPLYPTQKGLRFSRPPAF